MSQREVSAQNLIRHLEKRESSVKKREALLLEVEQCVAACHTSIEDCIEQEVKQNLKVSVSASGACT